MRQSSHEQRAESRSTLSLVDAVAIVVGVVVGAGIFKTPALVAAHSDSPAAFLGIWAAGGLASLVGGLCYAELASTYPHTGGEYHYLTRSFGPTPGFLFAWARLTVIQSGSIAMLAFLLGDYLTEIHPLGHYSATLYAAAAVVLLTAANMAGIRQGSGLQRVFTACIVLGLLIVTVIGLSMTPEPAAVSRPTAGVTLGGAMIFVLLTYGGWNEAGYLSAEVRDPQRAMLRIILASIGCITGIYLLVNAALLKGLGLPAMAGSEAVAADLMRAALGENGARFISLLVALTALSTMNGSIITGARSGHALGRDFPLLGFLGRWRDRNGTPVNALAFQGLAALLLVAVGTGSRGGFVMMVEYTAPVFWFFLFLVSVSILVLRRKEPQARRPFKVPLYPFTPLLFCAICLAMLASSLLFTGVGALLGLAVLATGLPVWLLNRTYTSRTRRNA